MRPVRCQALIAKIGRAPRRCQLHLCVPLRAVVERRANGLRSGRHRCAEPLAEGAPLCGGNVLAIHEGRGRGETRGGIHNRQQGARDVFRGAVGLPAHEAAPARHWIAVRRWDVLQAAAVAQDVEDAVERAPIVGTRPPPPLLRRQHAPDGLPLCVGERRRHRRHLAALDHARLRAPELDEAAVGFVIVLDAHLFEQVRLTWHDDGLLPLLAGEGAQALHITPQRDDDEILRLAGSWCADLRGQAALLRAYGRQTHLAAEALVGGAHAGLEARAKDADDHGVAFGDAVSYRFHEWALLVSHTAIVQRARAAVSRGCAPTLPAALAAVPHWRREAILPARR